VFAETLFAAPLFDRIVTWPHALAVVTVLAAGIVRGFTGFGSALVMVPLLAFVWTPAEAVGMALGLGFISSVVLIPKALPLVAWREIGPMTAATILFTPLGTLILVGVDGDLVRRIIAALILAITLVMLRGWQYRGPRGALPGFVAGTVGGVVNGIAAIGGPAAVLYLMSLQDAVATQRANIVVQVSLMGIVSSTYLILSGALEARLLIAIAALAAPMIFSTWIGGRLFLVLPASAFRRIIMWMLVVVSVTILVF
jgi:uncharacterized membrane protein YfcA